MFGDVKEESCSSCVVWVEPLTTDVGKHVALQQIPEHG